MTTRPHHSIPPVLPPPNCFSVLVVDDLAPNRILLSKVFKAAGYAVMEAENGKAALELLLVSQHRPDIIVTDIEMPVMDGISLIREIRNCQDGIHTIPIIAASGNASDEMANHATSAGSDLFMTKPFDLGQLRRQMARLLRIRRAPAHERGTEISTRPHNRIDAELGHLKKG